MPSPSHLSIHNLLKAAFYQNRFPAVILQLFAAGILCCYFLVPALTPLFEGIGQLKKEGGILFSVLSTACFGGLIPWIVLVYRGRIPPGKRLENLCFYLAFWSLQGFIVDRLYTYQTIWFGSEPTLRVLLSKMLVDQIPYNLLWATPNCVFFFAWKNASYDWRKLNGAELKRKYVTVQVSAWIVWVPAVTMVYALPPNLQVPLFNLVLCFYSLVLVFVSRD
ncbi:Mpv17/PMP22 family protein [Kiritimatiellota bacterium B12222]|nr:Mpv17/PMP22 family protein [Kiritimatiellota bacterium B12222]